jgi:circadian clock protein KaiB
MARKKPVPRRTPPAVSTAVVMVLYITENGPNSVLAIANLQAICKEHMRSNFKLEIVDVLEFPGRALADGVVVTPSLTKLSPSPAAKIVGNLSNRREVLRALGIAGGVSPDEIPITA